MVGLPRRAEVHEESAQGLVDLRIGDLPALSPGKLAEGEQDEKGLVGSPPIAPFPRVDPGEEPPDFVSVHVALPRSRYDRRDESDDLSTSFVSEDPTYDPHGGHPPPGFIPFRFLIRFPHRSSRCANCRRRCWKHRPGSIALTV